MGSERNKGGVRVQQQQTTTREELREADARLRAPQHLQTNRFEEHKKVEGYEQNRAVPDFYGCDRLWKLETIYGRIQMGYHPGRGQSFLFANIKTSIYDNAPSAYQRRMKETRQMRALKTGTQNMAFSSRRWQSGAVLLYKVENKPWSEQSIAPYLGRLNLETLQKTMPFLIRQESEERQQGREKKRDLEQEIQQALLRRDNARVAELRRQENELSHHQDALSALLLLKQAQSRAFFRKINIAFDLQKAKMFEYYRRVRDRRAMRAAETRAMNPTEENSPDAQTDRRNN